MSRVLENLQPERVFYYFEEICNIPHVSHHTERLSQYCEDFAKTHNLEYTRDALGNVIINKPATPGYENVPGVILQGHIDMVGAKRPESTHDFLNDPIELVVDGDWIKAKDTTLGADDGVAVAYALAILENNDLKHPRLQVVLTVDEEVGLDGAEGIDESLLDAGYMINLDSDDEGIFLTGSAGGLRTDVTLPVNLTEYEGVQLKIVINNMIGGHSGAEIGTGRPSANVLIGRVLKSYEDGADYYIQSMSGGEVDNAICRECIAYIVTDEEDILAIKSISERVMAELRAEYRGIDDNITISVEVGDKGAYTVADDFGREKILCLLRNLPYGVITRNAENINLVETSLNPGVLRFKDGVFKLGYSVRSSVTSAKRELADRIQFLTEYLGGNYEESGDYAAWTYVPESKLRDTIAKVYEEMYGNKPEFTTIHAGLECGIFSEKIPGIDIVSYGPESKDIHTYMERLSISSTKKAYEFTLKLLENIKE